MPAIRGIGVVNGKLSIILKNGQAREVDAIPAPFAGRTNAELEAIARSWAATHLDGGEGMWVRIHNRSPLVVSIWIGPDNIPPHEPWW